MGITPRQILIFVVFLLILIGIGNTLFRLVLPVKLGLLVSSSMEPAYNQGDIFFYGKAAEYKTDDAIMIQTGLSNILVRIIGVNDDGSFITKADANQASIVSAEIDQTHVTQEMILGKAYFPVKSYIFYPILYGVEILLAIFFTSLIPAGSKPNPPTESK
jgi:hypothetical protein